MARRFKYRWVVSISVIVLTMLNINIVCAVDELMLTGVVQSVDTRAGTILINVKSASCGGQKTFTADKVGHFEGLIGKLIRFNIASSSCAGNYIYKITQFKTLGEKQ